MNRFAYAEANPWTFSDPSGHATCFSTSDLCDEQMAIQHQGTQAAKAASGRIGGRLNAYYSSVRRAHATARTYEGTPGTAFETDWAGEGTWGEDRSIAFASAAGSAAGPALGPMECHWSGKAGCAWYRSGAGSGDGAIAAAVLGAVVIGGLVCVFGGCEAAAAAAAVYAGGEGIMAAAGAACMAICQRLATIGAGINAGLGGSPNPEAAPVTALEPTLIKDISTADRPLAEISAINEYAARSNAWFAENGPQVVQPTSGALRAAATAAARAERRAAVQAGAPYVGQAGHVPDTAISGQAVPPAGWLDMPGFSNQVCGGLLGPMVGQPIGGFTVDGKPPC